MKSHRAIPVIAAGGLVLCLAGCAGGSTDEPSALPEDELTTVNVAYSLTSTFSPLPFAVATANGYFAENGCRLGEQIEEALGGSNTMRSVIDGGLDMGEVATNAAIEAALSGTPVTVVGANDHVRPHDMLYAVRAGETVRSVSDLVPEGRLGFTNPGSVTEDLAYLMLDGAGLTSNDVELVPTNGLGGGLALLEGGDVDATVITPIIYQQNQDKYDIGFVATDDVPVYQPTVYVASDEFLAKNPEAVRCILAGLDKAMAFIIDAPDEAAAIYAEHNEDYTVEQLIDELNAAIEADSLAGSVGFNVEALEKVALARELRTGEETSIPWSEFIDPSFLPSGSATELPE